MKFKIEIFRDVLIYLEENLTFDNKSIESTSIQIKDYSTDDIAYQIEKIAEMGFIKYADLSSHWDRHKTYFIESLTMQGHEFLASVRNDTVWNKMAETSKLIGVEVVKSAIPLLLAYTKSQLGIP